MAYEDGKNTNEDESNLPDDLEVGSWLSSGEFVSEEEDNLAADDAGGASEAGASNALSTFEKVSWSDDEEVNPNKGLSFSQPAQVPGEQPVPYKELKLWENHPGCASRFRDANFEALCASANDPVNLAPLTVLRTKDGYMIMDGRLRWHAIGAVHGETSDIGVRCVVFAGTEEEAVQWVADSALGGMPRSQIEMARAILNLQRVASISQKAIGERYPVLKKDQVSRMTIAARAVERFPIVFDLLAEPDRVPIDTCVKFAQFIKAATDVERAQVLESAEVRMSEGVILKPGDLFDALGIETESSGGKAKASSAQDPTDVLETVDVLGFDDQPVGTIEKLDERVMRFQLPDPTKMTPDEREVAAQGFIVEIRAYFGLKVAG